MNPTFIVYAVLAVCVGALFPVQSAVNAVLGRGVGGPIAATLVSFAAGLIWLFAINAIVFRQWPSFEQASAQPWPLVLAGGALGAVFVSANVFLAPRFGAAATLSFVMAGQLLSALVIDRFGLFGFALRDLSFGRIGGVAMVLAGAILVRLT